MSNSQSIISPPNPEHFNYPEINKEPCKANSNYLFKILPLLYAKDFLLPQVLHDLRLCLPYHPCGKEPVKKGK